jgi:hypothetical protein
MVGGGGGSPGLRAHTGTSRTANANASMKTNVLKYFEQRHLGGWMSTTTNK